MLHVLTHHKCGSTTLLKYLQDLCNQNKLRFFSSHIGNTEIPSNFDVSLLSNAEYIKIYTNIIPTTLHVIRNPLNIVQSAYYSHRNTHDVTGWNQLDQQRNLLVHQDRAIGMLATAKFCNMEEFYPNTAGPIWSIRHWDYEDERVMTVRMEDYCDNLTDCLRRDIGGPVSELIWPDQSQYTFKVLSKGRIKGKVDDTSHYRSGAADAWTEELPSEVIMYVAEQCHEVIERFYPESMTWINRSL